MICSVPEAKVMSGPERPIAARLKLTSKNPLRAKLELMAALQLAGVHPVKEFANRIPVVIPRLKMNGEVLVGIVPVH